MNKISDLLFQKELKQVEFYENLYPVRNISKSSMVTRFAPSPTGFIHMGSLYTAFVCNTFAKQTDGIFYLRIEDTDQIRKVENGAELIIKDLSSFGLTFDAGTNNEGIYAPYIQSERKEIYQAYVKDLVDKDLAYPCFCTKEELEEMRKVQESNKERIGYYGSHATCRNLTLDEIKDKLDKKIPYVIRLKSNGTYENKVECKDEIKGKIEFPENDLDVVILKSDGLPTYHFAHVVDDHLMHTTHVIRGDEWLPSLPLHYQLFKTLGFNIPKYAHLSPLMKQEGNSIRKLSKRKDPECSIHYYQEIGIPSEAILLYFKTLMNPNFEQWYSSIGDKKPFIFEFNKMSTGGSLFDFNKLLSISKIYFSQLKATQIYEEALIYYSEYDLEFYNLLLKYKDYTISFLDIERNIKRPRKDIASYSDIKKYFWYFYDEYFDNEKDKFINLNLSKYKKNLLIEYLKNYYTISNKDDWYQGIKDICDKYNYSKSVKDYKDNSDNYIGHIGDICEMIRVALTTKLESPDLYEMLVVMGKERVEKRFIEFENFLEKNNIN